MKTVRASSKKKEAGGSEFETNLAAWQDPIFNDPQKNQAELGMWLHGGVVPYYVGRDPRLEALNIIRYSFLKH